MNQKSLFTHGVELSYEYYKIGPEGHLEKLAIADHTALWAKTGADGEKHGASWPELILKGLWDRIQNAQQPSPDRKDRVG